MTDSDRLGPARLWDALVADWRAERPVALVEVVGGPEELIGRKLIVRPDRDGAALGSLGDPNLDRVVIRDALGELAVGGSAVRSYGRRGQVLGTDVEVFIESFGPPPSMVIIGAVDFTAALGRVAKVLGYRVTVCDARRTFATPGRFPMADEIVVDWPQRHLERVGPSLRERDAICVLTHDPKFDIPALLAALATGAGYVGALGSRRTQQERMARLREAGVAGADLARIMAPIGLDIGARTPAETAVAICAEIIAVRAGKQAPSLRDGHGPIHGGPPTRPAPPEPGGREPAAAGQPIDAAPAERRPGGEEWPPGRAEERRPGGAEWRQGREE